MLAPMMAGGFRRAISGAAQKPPIRVAITGAAGQIGYAMTMRIAGGEMFGPDQPVIFNLIEVPQGIKALDGCVMELKDGAFPLLKGIVPTDNLETGFGDADVAVFVGASPRKAGMERKDLMAANARIFAAQGKVLDKVASRDVRALVVGNPANTNALVLSANAPSIPAENIMAMTRLDQNRAMGMIADKAGVSVKDVERVIIWGNHSATQYPDISHALIAGQAAPSVIADKAWLDKTLLPEVQQRGAAIIKARGASSAASAASAAIDHIRDMFVGSGSAWQCMGVPSDGSYDVEPGLWYSVPCICPGDKSYQKVSDLSVDKGSRARMVATMNELKEERDAVLDLLPSTFGKPGTTAKKSRGRQ